MALSDRKRQTKMIDEFLRNEPAQSGFLGELDSRISRNKQARAAARQTNRTIGAGAWQGKTPFGNNPAAMATNTGGAGGRAIMSQGLGPVGPVGGGPRALPPGGSRLPVPVNQPAPVPTGNLPVPAGGPPAVPGGPTPQPAIGPGARAMGPVGSTGPVAGSTARAAAAADDAVSVAGRAAASGADDVAAASARSAGTNAAKAGTATIRSTATNMGVNVTKAGLMRGAGVAGAGYMASQFIDGMNLGGEQSVLDKGASGAILGAGLGGGAALALGLGTGPVGWAALGGAALFAGGRMLFGGDDTKLETATKAVGETRETITELAGMYGIEGDALQDIMMQYDMSTQMLIDQEDTDGIKNFMAGVTTQLPAMMLQAREEQKAGEQEQMRYQNMMAAQAQFAPIFDRTLQRAEQASQTAMRYAEDSASVMDARHPQLGELFRQTAAQSQAAAANLRAAYARQMAQAPVVTGQRDEIERQLAQEELLQQQLAAGIGG